MAERASKPTEMKLTPKALGIEEVNTVRVREAAKNITLETIMLAIGLISER
tara:strand:- start:1601 stop:1753 length:153 start_codon:yes stop_codon:yes gene_type:complete